MMCINTAFVPIRGFGCRFLDRGRGGLTGGEVFQSFSLSRCDPYAFHLHHGHHGAA